MILTASGFFVFLLCMPAVQSLDSWGGTYSSTKICAVNGSTVEISCSFTYPSRIYGYDNKLQKTFWFTQKKDGELVDLKTDSEYAGRVEDLCENKRCTLRIKNLRESDSAKYMFRFITNKDAYTASPGVTLSVTDPDLLVNVMETMIDQGISRTKLQCRSRCILPHDPSYIWYKNGRNIRAETSSAFSVYFDSADSFSCALKGHENFPSPSHCVRGQTCNRVIYNDRSICAFKGSSVDISCTYSNAYVQSKFWFRPERYHQGQNASQPEDLSEDSQYAGRVQILETRRGRSTLRISDLRDSDSAQYRFKFKTPSFEWRSDLPGTTLTVTDPDLKVQVQGWKSSSWSKLQCYTSCRLPHGSSYIWYENGRKMAKETFSYSVYFGSTSSYSCAVRGHEDFLSPPVCVRGQTCNRVIYTERSICALEGSSVDISCTYNSYKGYVNSKFWFRPERSHQGQNPSQPEDLSEDSQYAGRVQILDTERGRSTLRISDLRDSDSAQYRFKFRTPSFEWRSDLPGTTLTVTALQVQVITSTVHRSYTYAELKCRSGCSPAGVSYVWFKNEKIIKEQRPLYKDQFYPGDIIFCALKGHKNYSSPLLYALKFPVVSVSPSDDIIEGSSVTLTCSSDANPAANYTWYKENGNQKLHPLTKERQLFFSSILVSDSGEYFCTAENELGKRTSERISVDVKYAPKLPSVSVSPSAEIEEGRSVTLTCSSDANPAANYTWYKANQTLFQGAEGRYEFTSISSEDSGHYYCKSENQYGGINSTSLFVDVLYAPKLPSVSVSASAEIEEGSSVTLTCSSDANPAANYTWYKEDEDSPKASGQIFTITDFRAEHRGSYSCGAQNKLGRSNSTFHQIVLTGAWRSRASGITTAVVLSVILLSIFLLIWKKKAAKRSSEPGEPNSKQSPQEELLYANVQFSKNQSDPLSSNIKDSVVYAEVKFNSAAPRSQMSATEDSTALYSTINTTRTQ